MKYFFAEILTEVFEDESLVPSDILAGLILLSHKARREKEEAEQKQAEKASLLDLFRHSRLRWRTLNLCFNWMVNSGTYYGLALSASNLGGNPYYNYLISAAVEIPAYAFNLLVLNNPR